MTDADMLTLNSYFEARGEPDDGVAAVCKVALNRAALRYASDGSLSSTILHPAAFSWTQFQMVDGRYVRVAATSAEQLEHVERCLAEAQADRGQWTRCAHIAGLVRAGEYQSPLFDRLGRDAVLYYAPAACAAPAWAKSSAFLVQIGGQRFYRDGAHPPTPAVEIDL